MRERARATKLVQRTRKFDIVALFYTLSLGFTAGSDRTIQAFLERYGEMSDCEKLSYSSFHGWFSPSFVALLRAILDDGRDDLNGRLERVRDVLIVDATIVSLYQDATDVYAATGDSKADLKLHLTESLSTGLPTRFRITDAKTQERSQLLTGEWVAGALVLLNLGFYDFWLFDRIDPNDGWFVSRVKDDANFHIVEELRKWRGNSIPLEGESLQTVLDDLQRQEIDVRIELSFDRKRGSRTRATRAFRPNLPVDDYSAPDRAVRYRAWEVELLFKELKSRFGLDEINTTDAYIIEALIIMVAISLMMSRVIGDELHKLDVTQRDDAADADASASRLPRRRCSLAVERHAHLIQLYLMLELGYELPDLDELLLWVSRNPNLHRPRLRRQVESGEPRRPRLTEPPTSYRFLQRQHQRSRRTLPSECAASPQNVLLLSQNQSSLRATANVTLIMSLIAHSSRPISTQTATKLERVLYEQFLG